MAKKKVIEVQAPVRILHLPYPTRLDGGKNTVIVKQVTKKYANIMILKPGTEEVHATIKSENGAGDNLGTGMSLWVYAVIDAALSGQGQSPDGSALYVADHSDTVLKHFGKQVGEYSLLLDPGNGRSGAKKYVGTINDFIALCRAKAQIIRQSEERYGVAKTNTRAQAATEEPLPTISF